MDDKLGDFYHQESSFKVLHRQFCDRYRTLFYINVHFKLYIFFRVKVPFKQYSLDEKLLTTTNVSQKSRAIPSQLLHASA